MSEKAPISVHEAAARIDHLADYEYSVNHIYTREETADIANTRVRNKLPQIEAGEMGENALELLHQEEKLLGVDAEQDTDAFLQARKELYLGVQQDAEQSLGPLKEELVDKLSSYFS